MSFSSNTLVMTDIIEEEKSSHEEEQSMKTAEKNCHVVVDITFTLRCVATLQKNTVFIQIGVNNIHYDQCRSQI